MVVSFPVLRVGLARDLHRLRYDSAAVRCGLTHERVLDREHMLALRVAILEVRACATRRLWIGAYFILTLSGL